MSDEVSRTRIPHWLDPSKVLGVKDNCDECHIPETEAWARSRHALAYSDLHKTHAAKEILDRMGLKSMKRSAECYNCHYTPSQTKKSIRARSGVSCESCHGAAEDWIDVHNTIDGDPDGKLLRWGDGKTETPAARDVRLAAAHQQGMVDSEMIVEFASICLNCHSLPSETLMNRGGHPTPQEFELLSWSQGEVRHSFVSSEGSPDNPTNREASQTHRRLLYAIGRLLNLSYALDNLQQVKEPGRAYHQAALAGVKRGLTNSRAIATRLEEEDLQEILSRVESTITKPSSKTEASSNRFNSPASLARELRAFAKNLASSDRDLSQLDPILPTTVR